MNTDQIIVNNFISLHPIDAAKIIESHKIEDIIGLTKELPDNLVVSIIHNMDSYIAVKCLEKLDFEVSIPIIEKLPPQLISAYLRQLNEDLREKILTSINLEISRPVKRILSYPETTAGALVDPNILTLQEEITVKDALLKVQKYSENVHYYLYIVNRDYYLTGITNLRNLMLARPSEQLTSIMNTNIVHLAANTNLQTLMDHPGWQKYFALPVVEENGMLLGVLNCETIRNFENKSRQDFSSTKAATASNALGELYKIGLSALFRSAAMPLKDISNKNKVNNT